jgi:hypothetical protein
VIKLIRNQVNIARMFEYFTCRETRSAWREGSDLTIAQNSNGCAYAANWPSTATLVAADVAGLPNQDIYKTFSGQRGGDTGDGREQSRDVDQRSRQRPATHSEWRRCFWTGARWRDRAGFHAASE